MSRFKDLAKKSAFLYSVNAKIKSLQLKRGLAKIARQYSRRAEREDVVYSPATAIEEFRHRHHNYARDFVSRPPGKLRVFWVGTSKSQDESGFLQALNRLCIVTVFQNLGGDYGIWGGKLPSGRHAAFSEVRSSNDQALLSQIREAHKSDGIDLLLGQMWASLISKEALGEVQAMGIPVINIAMDDRLPVHWSTREGVRLGSIGLASSLDMVLTTSSETCLYYGVEGCPALFWPLASDPGVYAPAPDQTRDIGVLFIGNKYGIRGEIVRHIRDHGIDVDCYGAGWSNGSVGAVQMADLSKRARIILGVGTVGHCSDVYTLKLRDFDAVMTGALYITHRNPDLCRLYEEGQEIECYDSPREATEKIRHYLDKPCDRERVGRAGQQKAMSRDTWDKRLATTFETLGLMEAPPPEGAGR